MVRNLSHRLRLTRSRSSVQARALSPGKISVPGVLGYVFCVLGLLAFAGPAFGDGPRAATRNKATNSKASTVKSGAGKSGAGKSGAGKSGAGKSGATAKSPRAVLRFQFSSASWQEVLDWLSRETGMAIDYTTLPKSKVTLHTAQRRAYSVQETLDLLSEMLFDRGFGLLSTPQRLTILDMREESNRLRVGRRSRLTEVSGLEQFGLGMIVKCELRLSGDQLKMFSKAKGKATFGKPLSRASNVFRFPGATRVQVADVAGNLRELVEQLNAVEESMLRVRLKNRNAYDLITEIRPLLASLRGGARGDDPGARSSRGVQLSPGDHGESVLIAGLPEVVEPIHRMIVRLDTEEPSERVIESYSLVGLNPVTIRDDVMALLAPMTASVSANRNSGGRGGRGSGGSSTTAGIVISCDGNCLWFAGSRWQHNELDRIFEKIRGDKNGTVAQRVRVIPEDSQRVRRAIEQARKVWNAGRQSARVIVKDGTTHQLVSSSAPAYTRPRSNRPGTLSTVEENEDINIVLDDGQYVLSSMNSAALQQYFDVVQQMLDIIPKHISKTVTLEHRVPSEVRRELLTMMGSSLQIPSAQPLFPAATPWSPSQSPTQPRQDGPVSRSNQQRLTRQSPDDRAADGRVGDDRTGDDRVSSDRVRNDRVGNDRAPDRQGGGHSDQSNRGNASARNKPGMPRFDFGPMIHRDSTPPVNLMITAHDFQSLLTLRGSESDVEQAIELCELLDVPTNSVPSPKRVALSHRSLEDCLQFLSLTLGSKIKIVAADTSPEDLPEPPFLLPDAEGQAIYIVANAEERLRIESRISAFDQRPQSTVEVFEVLRVTSPSVARALMQIVGSPIDDEDDSMDRRDEDSSDGQDDPSDDDR